MNCSPTLTAEEFKTIHNALWELDSVTNTLEDILKPELYVKLARAARTIREGLAGAYEQDDKAFSLKSRHFETVQEAQALKSIWSIYNVDNLNDQHPFTGACKVVYKDHWGGEPVEFEVVGSTWSALYVAADACIRNSGDDHHVFIENFTKSESDPTVLFLSTGS
jgi:hypothetical protein